MLLLRVLANDFATYRRGDKSLVVKILASSPSRLGATGGAISGGIRVKMSSPV